MTKKKIGQAAPPPTPYNGWRALTVFIEGVFGLINTKKIYPAFALVLLAICALVVFKLPGTELAALIKLFISRVSFTISGLMGLLIVTNVGWLYILKRLMKTYKAEIARLSDIKKYILHDAERKPIQHKSSNGHHEDSFILPDIDDKSGANKKPD